MKKITTVILTIILALALLCGCAGTGSDGKSSATATPDNGSKATTAPSDSSGDTEDDDSDVVEADEHFSKFDKNTKFSLEDAKTIDVSKGSVNITEEGTYILSGTLSDGKITVNVDKLHKVRLVLNNVNVTCSNGSALYVASADKVLIYLAEGTSNSFTDGKSYTNEEEKACIYSKDDLTINGTGSLYVKSNYNNGISSKNDLRIVGGNITVSAANNAIKGNDSVSICGGTIKTTACEDAIKTDSTELNEGRIYISGGTFDITATDDGLQASQDITVTGGTFTFKCGGKKVNSKGTKNTNGIIS